MTAPREKALAAEIAGWILQFLEDDGADYEAKVRDADAIMANSYNSTTPLRELIAAALAQSAAEMRERTLDAHLAYVQHAVSVARGKAIMECEAIAREHETDWHSISGNPCTRIADAITALAETKGEGR